MTRKKFVKCSKFPRTKTWLMIWMTRFSICSIKTCKVGNLTFMHFWTRSLTLWIIKVPVVPCTVLTMIASHSVMLTTVWKYVDKASKDAVSTLSCSKRKPRRNWTYVMSKRRIKLHCQTQLSIGYLAMKSWLRNLTILREIYLRSLVISFEQIN